MPKLTSDFIEKEKVKVKKALSKMFVRYFIRFVFRIAVFLFVFAMYIFRRAEFYSFIFEPFWWKISIFHILWLIFMVIMFWHLFPNSTITMGVRKAQGRMYEEKPGGYDEVELYHFVKDQNVKAWKTLLVWLLVNSAIAALYLIGIIGEVELWLCVVFFYLSDFICIMCYCPFQSHIMKNRCCVNCRIFDWGHFMMFTPTILMKGFFSWSLFCMSVIVLIHWEIIYAKHPERFWSGANRNLNCDKCKDKLCRIKKAYLPKQVNQWQDIKWEDQVGDGKGKNLFK